MSTHGRRGRPGKPYKASWGEDISGLRRERDGRWRIVRTRETFVEPDERRAIQRFRAWQDRQTDNTVELDYDGFESFRDVLTAVDQGAHVKVTAPKGDNELRLKRSTFSLSTRTPAAPLWSWLRKQLIDRPRWVAKMTGIPQLANLSDMPLPKQPIRLSRLLDLYRERADVKPESRREAAATFKAFMEHTKAQTLADLTLEVLAPYRDHIKAKCKSPATVTAYFGRIKNIIRFAKSEGEDAAQIDAALSRMAILKAPKDVRVLKPTPISRKAFDAIFAAAEEYPDWRARLLVMLNCCLHLDEALDVEWTDFDLKAKTFCTRRNKRGRVIRAATLWPNTIAALKALRKTGSPKVFVSKLGKRFNAKGQWKTWNRIRRSAGFPEVQMDDIRDGAYTVACNAPGVDEKFARLMAGHRAHGFQDNYVERNPAVVRPACQAVYKHYFGKRKG